MTHSLPFMCLIRFKIISHQIRLDRTVRTLLESVGDSFLAIEEIRDLKLKNALQSLEKSMLSLLDVLLETSLLLRVYLHQSFIGEFSFLDIFQLVDCHQCESPISTTTQSYLISRVDSK